MTGMLQFQKLNRAEHDRKAFCCGVPALDDFLRRYAAQNQESGSSTTHVLVDSDNPAKILGFVTLSTAELDFQELSIEDLRRFPRYPVSALRVSRLAVSLDATGKGLGGALIGFAVRQALKVREIAGVRILLVDAKNNNVAEFYKHFGFRASVNNPLVLCLVL